MNHGTSILNLDPNIFALLDDTMSIGREMHDDFISKQGPNLLDGDLFGFRDEEVYDNGGDNAQRHVEEVHVVFTVRVSVKELQICVSLQL